MSRDPRPPSLSRRRPARAAALAMTLGLGVLAGCSGDGESTAEPAATSATDQAQTLPTQTTEASPAPRPAQPSAAAVTPAPAPVALRAIEVEYAIELPSTELTAGSYTIEVVNEGDGTHDLVVEDAGGTDVAASAVLGPGQSGTVEVTLQPGEYVFYCSIGNHRQMGMEVAVTVV